MSDLFWLMDEQIERLRPFFPKSHGRPRVDARQMLSGIVFVSHFPILRDRVHLAALATKPAMLRNESGFLLLT